MANIFSGHSYQLVTTGASYAPAKSAAVDAGGYLVIINSQAENDFVYGLLSNACQSALKSFHLSASKSFHFA